MELPDMWLDEEVPQQGGALEVLQPEDREGRSTTPTEAKKERSAARKASLKDERATTLAEEGRTG